MLHQSGLQGVFNPRLSPKLFPLKKRVLVIDGHPDPESFCASLGEQYVAGARLAGHLTMHLRLRELNFDPNLKYGYRIPYELEPDLLLAQDCIKAADHIVIVSPVWWGSVPALLKGFLDRVMLPNFAFKFSDDFFFIWKPLLTGRSGRLLLTMNLPQHLTRPISGQPTINALKYLTLGFSGIWPIRTRTYWPAEHVPEEVHQFWLARAKMLGERAG